MGFERVARYDWRDTEHAEIDDYSQAYVPHMDKENGTLVSLNVQAYKPAERRVRDSRGAQGAVARSPLDMTIPWTFSGSRT